MTPPRIIGLMQVRDEWPLVALSASFALKRHVDELYVLVHSSSDGTVAGLERLCDLWPGRLHVLTYEDDDHFWQEACLTALIELSQASEPDWLYVLDGDEFLLTSNEGQDLRDQLAAVPEACSRVRYEVLNWVSFREFDVTRLDDYRRLTRRAEVKDSLNLSGAVCGEEIRRGNLNFFDLPFGSKIVFRNAGTRWIAAGTHGVKEHAGAGEGESRATGFRVAHLPFLTWSRLASRVTHGDLVIKDGFTPDHSWQSQLVRTLAAEDRLAEFWRSHSLEADGAPLGGVSPPTTVEDGALVSALDPIIDLLEEGGFWTATVAGAGARSLSGDPSATSEESSVPLHSVVHALRSVQLEGDRLREERDRAEREHENTVRQRDDAARERDEAARERDEAARERDEVRRERDRLVEEEARLRHAVEGLSAELAAAERDMHLVRDSASWRVTAPLRAAGRYWRPSKSRKQG